MADLTQMYGIYTAREMGKLRQRLNEFHRRGKPEWVRDLKVQIDAEVPYNDLVIPGFDGGKKPEFFPETTIAAHLIDLPSRSGPNSSRNKWIDFARITSTIEADVIEALSRDGIIKLLEERGILPIPEPKDEPKETPISDTVEALTEPEPPASDPPTPPSPDSDGN